MDKKEFKEMWEIMQTDGYFTTLPYYEDYF